MATNTPYADQLAASTVSAPTETLAAIDFRRNNEGKTVRVMSGEDKGKEGIFDYRYASDAIGVKWSDGTTAKIARWRLVIVTRPEVVEEPVTPTAEDVAVVAPLAATLEAMAVAPVEEPVATEPAAKFEVGQLVIPPHYVEARAILSREYVAGAKTWYYKYEGGLNAVSESGLVLHEEPKGYDCGPHTYAPAAVGEEQAKEIEATFQSSGLDATPCAVCGLPCEMCEGTMPVAGEEPTDCLGLHLQAVAMMGTEEMGEEPKAAHPVDAEDYTTKRIHTDEAEGYFVEELSLSRELLGCICGGPFRGYWFDAPEYGPGKCHTLRKDAYMALIAKYKEANTEGAFELSVLDGYELPVKPRPHYPSLAEAAHWVRCYGFPLYWFYVTEYEVGGAKDAYGCRERVGGCNLEEADGAGYVSLAF